MAQVEVADRLEVSSAVFGEDFTYLKTGGGVVEQQTADIAGA